MSQLTNDPQKNYDMFIEDILATGKVWVLKSEDGWVLCKSEEYEDADVIPFWSNKAHAKAHCTDEWSNNTVESINVVDFVEKWLTGMAEDGFLVGPNWNAEMMGLEIEPGDLAEHIIEADS